MDKPQLQIPPILEKYAASIDAMLEPSLDLELFKPQEGFPVGASKLFGAPSLQHIGDWPRSPEGAPLAFVGQLNLAELLACGLEGSPLPAHGLLSFFYDIDGDVDGKQLDDRYRFRVLWSPVLEGQRIMRPPQGAPELGAQEWGLRPRACWRLPSEIEAGFILDGLSEREFCAFEDLPQRRAPSSGHQVLGPADWLEEDARALCASVTAPLWSGGRPDWDGTEWRLLWQVDGSPHLSDAFGAEVRLYVMIRREDLAERRFLRAWTVLQRG